MDYVTDVVVYCLNVVSVEVKLMLNVRCFVLIVCGICFDCVWDCVARVV